MCGPRAQRCTPPDADLLYVPALFDADEAAELFGHLREEIAWRQEHVKLFGRRIAQPRLTAWYGDSDATYTYSGLTLTPRPWIDLLQRVRERCSAVCGQAFNGVLLNYYRHGDDSMGWHADDERELGAEPVIASVSLGAVRRFELRHRRWRDNGVAVQRFELAPGSLLVMRGATQRHWVHRVPKQRRVTGQRINLTFRRVLTGR